MGVFCDRLKLGSTASPGLPDWPKQRQILRKRALTSTRLVDFQRNCTTHKKDLNLKTFQSAHLIGQLKGLYFAF